MKKTLFVILALVLGMNYCQFSLAGEHGGKEHKGSHHEHGGEEKGSRHEHGGESKGSKTINREPSSDEIRGAMKNYVFEESKKTGTFDIYDNQTGKTRRLALVRVHKRVGKTGDYYYSCADFRDIDSGELLDLDLDVEDKNGKLSTVDVRIHKLSGKERYTYDANDNRIPILDK